MQSAENEYLVVCSKQLGDQVLLEPALRKIAAAQGAPVPVIAPPAFAPLFELMEHARPVTARTAPRSRRLIALDPGWKSSRRAFLARAATREILLFNRINERPYHRFIYDEIRREPLSLDYRSHYYWKHVPGEAGEFHPPRLPIPAAPPATLAPEPGSYVLLHTTSAHRRKCWSLDRWADLVRHLRDNCGLSVLLSGGPTEWEVTYARDLAEEAGIPEENVLAGKTSLSEFFQLVAHSRFTIAIDSSASHLARAFGRPCITLFVQTDPVYWHWDSPIAKAVFPSENGEYTPDAAGGIPVDTVIAIADKMHRP